MERCYVRNHFHAKSYVIGKIDAMPVQINGFVVVDLLSDECLDEKVDGIL